MYENYMISEAGFRNTARGRPHHRLPVRHQNSLLSWDILSMLEDFVITVDGVRYPREAIRFAYRGQNFSLDKLRIHHQCAVGVRRARDSACQ